MTFLAPFFLGAAFAGALGVVALHFIVTRRPRAVAFPTARFVPDLPVTARSRSVRFSDVLLMLVRVLVILFAGLSLARPVFPPQRERVTRVVLADVSGAAASIAEVRDSVRALIRPGDALVTFDTMARQLPSPDSLSIRQRMQWPGSLSAGLVAGLRSGSRLRGGSDSVELVIVSPVLSSEADRATLDIRRLWRGRARVVPVAGSTGADTTGASEPVRYATEARPPFAVARSRVDTVGAVVSGDVVVTGQFERRWRYTRDSIAAGRVLARWIDGEPAAVVRHDARGCTRSVAVPMDTAGDMPLRPEVVRFGATLSDACGSDPGVADSGLARALTGSGRLASSESFAPAMDVNSPLARWLAMAAIILALGEMILRRTRPFREDS